MPPRTASKNRKRAFGERDANFKVETRATETPEQRAAGIQNPKTDITNLPREQAQAVQDANSLAGRKAANAALEARAAQITADPEAQKELQAQEEQNRAASEAFFNRPEDTRTQFQRTAEAGFQTVAPVVQGIQEKFGIKASTPEQLAQSPLGAVIGAPLGFISAQGFGGYSLNPVFSGKTVSMKQIAGNAKLNALNSKIISQGVTAGADIDDAITDLEKTLSLVNSQYAAANKIAQDNPAAIAQNIDFAEEAYNSSLLVRTRLTNLKRLKATGNYQQFAQAEAALGTGEETAQQ